MEIIKLEEDLLIYRFLPEKDSIIGINIYVILNNEEAIIIDTGYLRHFIKVIADLNLKNIIIKTVILTHFHPDHIGGLKRLQDKNIIGSIFARDTLKLYNKDITAYLPKTVVVDQMKLNFGRHTLLLKINQGHSVDGLLIELNKQYLFVGDDIISNNEGEKVLPFPSLGDVDAHIASLKLIISKLGNKTVLPSHGLPLVGDEAVLNDIISRLTYLYYLKENPHGSYYDFFKETNVSFVTSDWHVLNKI